MKKNAIIIAFLLLISATAQAQYNVAWEEPFGSVNVAADASNNVYTLTYEYNLGKEMKVSKHDADGNFIWETSFDQTDNTKWERAQWITTDRNGNVIVCGTYMSGFSNPVVAASILMKFKPNGTLVWRQVYENSFDGSRTVKCLVDSLNNIYVLGLGSGPNGYVTRVKKFKPNGTALWDYFDADGIGAGTNFKFTPDHHIVITGRGTIGSVNGYAKIDLNGNKIWSLPGIFSLTAGDCAGDAYGNTYVVHGEYVNNGGTQIKKLDAAGNIVWDSLYSPIAGSRIEVGTDNRPVVSGFPNVNSAGAAFLKTDENGQLEWLNLDADGPQALLLHSYLLLDKNNNAYLSAGTLFQMAVCRINSDGTAGWTALTSGGYATGMALGNGLNSIFVTGGTFTARLNYEGAPAECVPPANVSFSGITQTTITVQWDAVPGVIEYEIWRKKSSSSNWKIQFVPGDKTSKKFKNLPCGTGFDFQIRSICDEAGTEVSEFSGVYQQSTNACRLENETTPEHPLVIYPNPADEVLTIELNLPADFRNGAVELIDLTGRIMISQRIQDVAETLTLDVGRLTPGVYLLQGYDQQQKISRRVVIE
jgi:hypothetical protein